MTELLKLIGLDGIDDMLNPIILALPVFVLATLFAIMVRVKRTAKIKRARSQETSVRHVSAQEIANRLISETPVQDVVENAAVNDVRPQIIVERPPDVALVTATAPTIATPTAPNRKSSEKQERENPIAELQSQINDAMKVQPNNTIAPLFLEMARHHKAVGDESAYLAALRSAAGLAAQHGPRAAHAEARLQLAEAAYVTGDLTGACEQWQLARDALYDDGQKDAYARVDNRMRDNGCPTDWVLNDF